MDPVSSLLADQHTRGAFVIRSDLAAPWALRIEDRAPLTVVAVVRGSAVLCPEAEERVAMSVGDVALVRGTVDYTIADDPGSVPLAVVGPGQTCTRPDGSPLSELRMLGARAWSNVTGDAEPETVLLTGTYSEAGQVSRRVLSSLPDIVLAPAASVEQTAAATTMLAAETRVGAPAQDVVTDRLVDLVTVAVLRWWLATATDRPESALPHDDVAAGAVRRIHHEPHRPWTVASLGAELGVSRATLSRRFTAATGVPVIEYLTRWRLDLAADLLVRTDLTVASIATRVGYASAFSLSTAFSRRFGCPPRAYRAGSFDSGPAIVGGR